MSEPAAPSISVVIPTHQRPELLRRAVESCLPGTARGLIEVIVVANGCKLAQESVSRFAGVRVIELAEANGNAARNAGLAAARGRFVRFLDDDDYLLPEGASLQHAVAAEADADVCTGAIRLLDASGHQFQVLAPHPAGDDFVAAMLSPGSTTQPTAHLFRTEFLKNLWWDPARPHLQDFAWMHAIMRRGDAKWVTVDQAVGVWQHHLHARVSTGALKQFPDMALREMTAITSETVQTLEDQGRLTAARRRAAAQALWHCAHLGFPFSPRHWTRIALLARTLDPTSRPAVNLYHRAPWRYLHPLVLEFLVLPKRSVTRAFEGRFRRAMPRGQ